RMRWWWRMGLRSTWFKSLLLLVIFLMMVGQFTFMSPSSGGNDSPPLSEKAVGMGELQLLQVDNSLQDNLINPDLEKSISFKLINVNGDVQIFDSQQKLLQKDKTQETHRVPDSQISKQKTTVQSQTHKPQIESLGFYGDWKEVLGTGRQMFVYSAYLDNRKQPRKVRIITIAKKKYKVNKCQLYSNNNTISVGAQTKVIKESWNLQYAATYVLCDVPGDFYPNYVALYNLNGKPDESSKVPVQDLSLNKRSHENSMSVCVKPFHYNFNRAVWLVEFIEFYRILGVDKFIFYNHTVGPDVERVLRYYEKENIASTLPWSLPVKSQKEIRTEGIFAALNDCNLRSVGHFAFSAMVDVDEFLIPRKHNTYQELIKEQGDFDMYNFQNVFFYLYWDNDTAVHDALHSSANGEVPLSQQLWGSEEKVPYLLTAYKTTRLNKPHKHGTRSKYIVRPERVLECGNHVVWEHVGSKKVKNIPDSIGLSHHYRICEFGGFDCLKLPHQVDRIAHKWLIPLEKRVSSGCRNIFPDEPSCPVAPPLGSPW
ncbi:unnamed protein product, partial [Meganyctiphanes norvegica]